MRPSILLAIPLACGLAVGCAQQEQREDVPQVDLSELQTEPETVPAVGTGPVVGETLFSLAKRYYGDGRGRAPGRPERSELQTEPETVPAVGTGPVVEDTAPPPPPPPGVETIETVEAGDASPPAGGRRHTLQKGETLFSLAKRYYGDGKRWTLIDQANRAKYRHYTAIPAGTVLVIPPR